MSRRRLSTFVATLLTAGVVAVGPLAPTPATADPVVLPGVPELTRFDPDRLFSCTQLTPHTISVDSRPVRLDVRILLDGVPKAEAERAVVSMRRAYAPLRIGVVPSFQRVRFAGRDADALNQQAKRLYRGQRPRGVDVVYTMTSKDLTAGGPSGDDVAGLADCIGGVRFADRAFAVGEVFGSGSGLREGTGKTMAHEIGHLLGGQHHYFSPEGVLAADPNLGSLMSPTLDLVALRFSTLNSLVVRGHAQRYVT